MKKNILLISLITISFFTGFAFHHFIQPQEDTNSNAPRATGIGGIFFKCQDPKNIREWYKINLGLQTNPYGAVFEWYQGADSTQKGFTTWSPFQTNTKYFEPSSKEFMINYRVQHLEALLEILKKNQVIITDTITTYDYGKFVHVMDPEGNKLELWEPKDQAYEQLGIQTGYHTTK